MSSKIEFTINILFHMLILFCILTLIFWVIISKLTTASLEYEVKHFSDSMFAKTEKLSPEEKAGIATNVSSNEPALQALRRMYSAPDKNLQTNNKWLLVVNILIIGIILLTVLVIIAVFKMGCGINPPVLLILRENIIVFTIIGVIEYLFFMMIAKKFIPVLPSQFSKDVLTSVKEKL